MYVLSVNQSHPATVVVVVAPLMFSWAKKKCWDPVRGSDTCACKSA